MWACLRGPGWSWVSGVQAWALGAQVGRELPREGPDKDGHAKLSFKAGSSITFKRAAAAVPGVEIDP